MARAALQDSTGSETICSISAKLTYFLQKQMLRQRLENKSCLAEGEDAGAGGTKKGKQPVRGASATRRAPRIPAHSSQEAGTARKPSEHWTREPAGCIQTRDCYSTVSGNEA